MLRTTAILFVLAAVLIPASTQAAIVLGPFFPQSANAGLVDPHYVHIAPSPTLNAVPVRPLTAAERDEQIRNLLAQIELIKIQLIALQATK